MSENRLNGFLPQGEPPQEDLNALIEREVAARREREADERAEHEAAAAEADRRARAKADELIAKLPEALPRVIRQGRSVLHLCGAGYAVQPEMLEGLAKYVYAHLVRLGLADRACLRSAGSGDYQDQTSGPVQLYLALRRDLEPARCAPLSL